MKGLNGDRIRVLMVLPMLAHGGAEFLVRNMLENGFSSDFDVSLCLLSPSQDKNSEQRIRDMGVKVHNIGLERRHHLVIILELYRIFRKIRPHVIHTHLYSLVHCLIPSVLTGIPARVHTIHSIAWHDGSFTVRMAARIASRLLGFTLPGISTSIAGTIKKYYHVANVPVINNGIPAENIREGGAKLDRGEFGFSERDYLCVHVGSFLVCKNHAMLINSFNEVLKVRPETALLLVGDGPLRAEMEGMARELGISGRVRFAGIRDDVMGLLRISDLFVLSSHFEGLPISVLEAMSSGLPVVATDVGGVRDLVLDGKTGYLVLPGDMNGFAHAILKMASSRERARELGAAGRERVRNEFSISSTVLGYERLYKQILESSDALPHG